MTHYIHDKQYMDTLTEIAENGIVVTGRNLDVKKIHGRMTRYNLRTQFPLLLGKKVLHESVFKELFWMNRGETNINTLGCGIWNKWADANGELGPVYGEQLRKQVFFKLAATQEQFDKYKEAGYVSFGCAELCAQEMIEEFGQKEFERYVSEGIVTSHPVEDAGGVIFDEYSVSLMRKKVDQLMRAIKELEEVNKTGVCNRRMIICLWNNADVDMQALPPCHTLYNFMVMPIAEKERYEMYCETFAKENLATYEDAIIERGEVPCMALRDMAESEIHHATYESDPDVRNGGTEFTISEALDRLGVPKFQLDCCLYQRSNDEPAGVPFNVSSYALQTMLVASSVNMIAGDFIHFQGDVHIYENQFEAVAQHMQQYQELLDDEKANPEDVRHYPTLRIKSRKPIDEYTLDDIEVIGYDPKPFVPVPVTE